MKPLFACALAVLAGAGVLRSNEHELGRPFEKQAAAGTEQAEPLVQPGDLVWDGAFRVPRGNVGISSFGYSGWGMAYNAANGSLFVVGHDYQQAVAEITIPEPVKTRTLGELPAAKVLQPFADATEGRMAQIGGYRNYKIGGLLVYGGRLVGAAYSYFDSEFGAVASHFTHSLRLDEKGAVTGMHRVGDRSLNPAFYGGNMALVPPEWQQALGGPAITGGCCLPIITRTSFGPSAFAFDPAQLGVKEPAKAHALVYYPEGHVLRRWDESDTNEFNGSTEMAGALIPFGTRSLLFIGRQGTGKYCYRCPRPNDPYCFGQSIFAPPYQVQVWAYDLKDLARVKAGHGAPWHPRPYAIWALTGNTHPEPLPFFNTCIRVRGVAYDPASQRVWISAPNADGENPVIHQFHVKVAAKG